MMVADEGGGVSISPPQQSSPESPSSAPSYAVDYETGKTYDVSNPAAPVEIRTTPAYEQSSSGGFVYNPQNSAGIQNYANAPTNPTVNTNIAVDYETGQSYDVTNPARPTPINTVPAYEQDPSGNFVYNPNNTASISNYANTPVNPYYQGGQTWGTQPVNAAPTTYSEPLSASAIGMARNAEPYNPYSAPENVVVDYETGQVYDVTNPANPVNITPDPAYSFTPEGVAVYNPNNTAGIENYANAPVAPYSPPSVNAVAPYDLVPGYGLAPGEVAVDYETGQAYDVSDPSNPVAINITPAYSFTDDGVAVYNPNNTAGIDDYYYHPEAYTSAGSDTRVIPGVIEWDGQVPASPPLREYSGEVDPNSVVYDYESGKYFYVNPNDPAHPIEVSYEPVLRGAPEGSAYNPSLGATQLPVFFDDKSAFTSIDRAQAWSLTGTREYGNVQTGYGRLLDAVYGREQTDSKPTLKLVDLDNLQASGVGGNYTTAKEEAFYNPKTNEITVYYRSSNPEFIKDILGTMEHEVGHSLSNEGRPYDTPFNQAVVEMQAELQKYTISHNDEQLSNGLDVISTYLKLSPEEAAKAYNIAKDSVLAQGKEAYGTYAQARGMDTSKIIVGTPPMPRPSDELVANPPTKEWLDQDAASIAADRAKLEADIAAYNSNIPSDPTLSTALTAFNKDWAPYINSSGQFVGSQEDYTRYMNQSKILTERATSYNAGLSAIASSQLDLQARAEDLDSRVSQHNAAVSAYNLNPPLDVGPVVQTDPNRVVSMRAWDPSMDQRNIFQKIGDWFTGESEKQLTKEAVVGSNVYAAEQKWREETGYTGPRPVAWQEAYDAADVGVPRYIEYSAPAAQVVGTAMTLGAPLTGPVAPITAGAGLTLLALAPAPEIAYQWEKMSPDQRFDSLQSLGANAFLVGIGGATMAMAPKPVSFGGTYGSEPVVSPKVGLDYPVVSDITNLGSTRVPSMKVATDVVNEGGVFRPTNPMEGTVELPSVRTVSDTNAGLSGLKGTTEYKISPDAYSGGGELNPGAGVSDLNLNIAPEGGFGGGGGGRGFGRPVNPEGGAGDMGGSVRPSTNTMTAEQVAAQEAAMRGVVAAPDAISPSLGGNIYRFNPYVMAPVVTEPEIPSIIPDTRPYPYTTPDGAPVTTPERPITEPIIFPITQPGSAPVTVPNPSTTPVIVPNPVTQPGIEPVPVITPFVPEPKTNPNPLPGVVEPKPLPFNPEPVPVPVVPDPKPGPYIPEPIPVPPVPTPIPEPVPVDPVPIPEPVPPTPTPPTPVPPVPTPPTPVPPVPTPGFKLPKLPGGGGSDGGGGGAPRVRGVGHRKGKWLFPGLQVTFMNPINLKPIKANIASRRDMSYGAKELRGG